MSILAFFVSPIGRLVGVLLIGVVAGGVGGYKLGHMAYEQLKAEMWEEAARENAATVDRLRERERAIGDATTAKQVAENEQQAQIQIVRKVLYRDRSVACTPDRNPVIRTLLDSVQFRPRGDEGGNPPHPGAPAALQAPASGPGDKAGR